jgi:hypothetical protein
MRPDPRATWASGGGSPPPPLPPPLPEVRPDFGPEELSGAKRAFKGIGAFTRWVLLVVVVGVITAAVIAVAVAALFTLAESSV